jgi:hypothetical protein
LLVPRQLARSAGAEHARVTQTVTPSPAQPADASPPARELLRAYGKCHPSDCPWGRITARRLANGKVYGVYDHGFAKRYVWARMSQTRPGQLWVFYRVDFADPARADYTMHEYFRKVS